MFCSRRLLQWWSFAVFLLCAPVPHYGRPIDALTNRVKRSVTHAQLMHDKSRTLQDFKRRTWLQELLEEVHTAEDREQAPRGAVGGTLASGGIAGGNSGGSLHPKPESGTKNFAMGFPLEEEGTNLPQETNKSQTYKDQPLKAVNKKKKKGRTGKRRESEKKRRRARSLPAQPTGSVPQLERRPYSRLPRKHH